MAPTLKKMNMILCSLYMWDYSELLSKKVPMKFFSSGRHRLYMPLLKGASC